jgi:hypothetical protein
MTRCYNVAPGFLIFNGAMMAGLYIYQVFKRFRKHQPVSYLALASILLLAPKSPVQAASNPTLAIQTGTGIAIGGAHPFYSGSIGNVNGLGVGTPASGVSMITSGVGNAIFYYTPYNYNISNLNGSASGALTAWVSTNFSHPAILTLYTCTSGCTSFSSYNVMSTNSADPNTLVTGGADGSTSTAYIGVLVSNANGASAFSGSDSLTISFTLTNNNNGKTDTVTLVASVNVQTALSLTLATASGGLTVSSGSDFSMNFGNVNGLGINPAAGLTATAATGGYLYSTPYVVIPQFSSFTTTAGTLKVYVSTNFIHTAILQLQDSATSGGTYSAISTNGGGQTSITTSATTGTSVTRYLGLWVSNANGAGAFTGADNATLTYSVTVP